jgi:hypothetical protein
MPHDYSPEEDIICDKGIAFNLHNGKIHDSKGIKEETLTFWRDGGEKIPLNKLA